MADEIKTEETQTPATEPVADKVEAAAAQLDEAAVNKIVSARLQRETAKLQRAYDAKLAEVTAALTAPKDETKPAADHVKTQHEAALAKIASMEQERVVERQEAAKAEEKAALAQAMSELGAVNQKALVALLREEGRVTRNEAGELVFKGALKDMSLKEGLSEYLMSDEGKFFKAPTGAAGSGGSSAKADATPRKMTEAEAANLLFSSGFFSKR